MFAITVYVNIIVYIYPYMDTHTQVFSAIIYDALTGCNAERLSELLISEKFKSLI